MKKLMIAAAAAAMIGGAEAADNYLLTTNKVEFTNTQVLTWKTKKTAAKYVNLNSGKKFGKAIKFTTEAVDGVMYYSVKHGGWIGFEWSKDFDQCNTNVTRATEYYVYVDATTTNAVDLTTTKAIASYSKFSTAYEKKPGDAKWEWDEKTWAPVASNAVNAASQFFGKLKVKNGAIVKDEIGTTIRSVKSLDPNTTITVKEYKTAEKKAKAVNKIIDKALKVVADAAYQAYIQSIKE